MKTKNKTIVLFIYGTDFAAQEALNTYDIKTIVKMVKSNKPILIFADEDHKYEVEAEIIEYDSIDKRFIDKLFHLGILDSDIIKSSNFYFIDEKGNEITSK